MFRKHKPPDQLTLRRQAAHPVRSRLSLRSTRGCRRHPFVCHRQIRATYAQTPGRREAHSLPPPQTPGCGPVIWDRASSGNLRHTAATRPAKSTAHSAPLGLPQQPSLHRHQISGQSGASVRSPQAEDDGASKSERALAKDRLFRTPARAVTPPVSQPVPAPPTGHKPPASPTTSPDSTQTPSTTESPSPPTPRTSHSPVPTAPAGSRPTLQPLC